MEVRGLVRRFGSVEALAGINLAIRSGEFFSLLGPSGCGKTTLLRLIAGLDQPDSGTLFIDGQDVAAIPAHQRPVNTVFQSYALFPHLNVQQNVAFGLRMRKRPQREIFERVQRALDLVQVTDLAQRRPSELSGGQKQRVALARALINEPRVLLLDEPLGALDLQLRRHLQTELHALQRRLGITFIHVTHDQEEALAMSDRIAVLRAGRVEQVADAPTLYNEPQTCFVASFVGTCNLIDVSALAPGDDAIIAQTPLGSFSVAQRFASSSAIPLAPCTLAIRPERVRLLSPDACDGPNRIRARVRSITYGGSETRIETEAGGFLITALALNTDSDRSPKSVGAEIRLEFPANALRLLAS